MVASDAVGVCGAIVFADAWFVVDGCRVCVCVCARVRACARGGGGGGGGGRWGRGGRFAAMCFKTDTHTHTRTHTHAHIQVLEVWVAYIQSKPALQSLTLRDPQDPLQTIRRMNVMRT